LTINEGIFMKFVTLPIMLFLAAALSACAAVYTDASDSNHVTFLNSSDESMEQLTQKANAYCQQYGKTASFRKSDTEMVAVFDCNAPRQSAR
jgi:hypothetical protein